MNDESPNKQESRPEAAVDRDLSTTQSALPSATLPLTNLSSTSEGTEEESIEKPPLNRRRFLGGLLGGAAALVAGACGRDRATPTPTLRATSTPSPIARSSIMPSPTATGNDVYLPLVHNKGDIAVAAAPTVPPEPTATPTPAEPTATPPPPPTPTPIATRFPPGPPSKLGLVVMRNDPKIFDLLATQSIPVVCTLELDPGFLAQMKLTAPNTYIVARLPDNIDQIDLSNLNDPIGAARVYVEERLLPYAEDPRRQPYIEAWQGYNEPVAGNADEMKRLADFEAERTRLLAARGIRSVIGNFGAGQPTSDPPFALWEHFLPAVQAAKENNGWLGLHEYSAPTIYHLSTRDNQGRYPGVSTNDTGWLTLRYRQVYNQILKPANLAIPLVFTELGVDGLIGGHPGPADGKGWQHFQQYWAENGYGLWGPGAYVEQLVWFDNAMRQDEYVLSGCIYAMAASAGWESYDILGPAAGVLEQYLSVHTPGG
ncbi:MAG: hypothetical protein R2932_15035 [Caldilineaceae bacterium]